MTGFSAGKTSIDFKLQKYVLAADNANVVQADIMVGVIKTKTVSNGGSPEECSSSTIITRWLAAVQLKGVQPKI